MQRLHLHIYGRVQGVYFRVSVKEQADKIGLVGWVRNCSDGHVELVAEGNTADLNYLLAWCHKGPELAKVVRIEEIWSDKTGVLVGFDIRPTFR